MATFVRYYPWAESLPLREAQKRAFEKRVIPASGVSRRSMHSNLYETASGFVLQVLMPGVNPDEVEITVQQEALTLTWQTAVSIPEKARTHWAGFTGGKYQQQFTLPAVTDAEKAVATYENGVLILTLPKAEYAKAHRVKVTSQPAEPALA